MQVNKFFSPWIINNWRCQRILGGKRSALRSRSRAYQSDFWLLFSSASLGNISKLKCVCIHPVYWIKNNWLQVSNICHIMAWEEEDTANGLSGFYFIEYTNTWQLSKFDTIAYHCIGYSHAILCTDRDTFKRFSGVDCPYLTLFKHPVCLWLLSCLP